MQEAVTTPAQGDDPLHAWSLCPVWVGTVLVLEFILSPAVGGVHADARLAALRDLCIRWSDVGGTFVQVGENPATRRRFEEAGRFAWVRPDRLWWRYDRPEPKTFIWTPGRMEFYVEADCIVYYEDRPDERLRAHPLVAFVRDCDFQGLAMELRRFKTGADETAWVFEAPASAEADPQVPWARVAVRWRPRDAELTVETTDWLRRRVEYRLRPDPGVRTAADRDDVWHVAFPAACERVPLSELGNPAGRP